MAFREVPRGEVLDEEAALIYQAQASESAAWDEIFHRCYDHVFTFALCKTGERAAAEDITAEVFLEAWRGIRRFKYRGTPLVSWLYKIGHNLVADYHRKRNRSKTQPLGDETGRVSTQLDEAEQIALWQSVAAAMKRLTLEQQQCWLAALSRG